MEDDLKYIKVPHAIPNFGYCYTVSLDKTYVVLLAKYASQILLCLWLDAKII